MIPVIQDRDSVERVYDATLYIESVRGLTGQSGGTSPRRPTVGGGFSGRVFFYNLNCDIPTPVDGAFIVQGTPLQWLHIFKTGGTAEYTPSAVFPFPAGEMYVEVSTISGDFRVY